jgi:hypothetical protein
MDVNAFPYVAHDGPYMELLLYALTINYGRHFDDSIDEL